MKICDDLRQAVLQAAIQGKLTTQRKEDGDARELLKQIAAEKAKLIKEKKIKKEKPLPEITEEEIPFEVPENWVWVRINNVIDVRDGTHDTPTYVIKGFPLITGKDFYTGRFELSKTKYISEEDFLEIAKRSKVDIGDILFSMIGGNIGSMISITKDNYFDMAIKNVALFKQYNYEYSLNEFLFVFLKANVETFKDVARGGAQSFVSLNLLREYLFPLPPLAEQHRIVAKVEKLMAEIDELEKVENELNALKTAFPGDMKAALLQAAMQGKLTTQRKEDGDARELLKQIAKEKEQLIKEKKIKKEKSLPEITDDEIPFDVPDNWVWVRLRDICTKIVDGDHNPPKKELSQTEFVMLSSQNVNNDKLVDLDNVRFISKRDFVESYSRTMVTYGDILFTCVGTLGRSCVFESDLKICLQRSVSVMSTLVYNKYLKYYLDSPFIQSYLIHNAKGTAQKGFYLNQLERLIITVPPLAEQQRIVAKLEKLLPLCDGLVEE